MGGQQDKDVHLGDGHRPINHKADTKTKDKDMHLGDGHRPINHRAGKDRERRGGQDRGRGGEGQLTSGWSGESATP